MWFEKYLSDSNHSNTCCATDRYTKLSYGALRTESLKVAQKLVEYFKVKPGDLVGVMMNSSTQMLIAYHGIWLAGCAFVPIDAGLPIERMQYMVEDSAIKLVITEKDFLIDLSMLQSVHKGELKRFVLPMVTEMIEVSSEDAVSKNISNDHSVAYVIYTSGTTGKPKGAACTHKGLDNVCNAAVPIIGLKVGSIFLQFANISFDASLLEIFASLVAFGTVACIAGEYKVPGKKLARHMNDRRVTHMMLPPTILGMLTEYSESLLSLETVIAAGEPFPIQLARKWIRPGRKIFNAYGVTEAAIISTLYEINGNEDKMPIGTPLKGVTFGVLNDNADGYSNNTSGELAIGGEGVAVGYLNKPEITERHFKTLKNKSERCYLTGDLVIHDANGLFYYSGRADRQIKVRGFRVELQEIENVLHKLPGVQACAVKVFSIADSDVDRRTIVAYVSISSDVSQSEATVKQFLSNQLPVYMLPNHVVFLDNLPMMPNAGKVNVNALLFPTNETKITTTNIAVEEKPRQTKTRLELICEIFARALNYPSEQFKPDDDLFVHGADSLHACQILNDVEEHLEKGRNLPFSILYEKSTPRSLLEFCENVDTTEYVRKIESCNEELFIREKYQLPPTSGVKLNRLQDQSQKVILLTGANGFLGAHILNDLLQQFDSVTVYCIVRVATQREAANRLQKTLSQYSLPPYPADKVVALAGDITIKELGLIHSTYANLTQTVNVVVHSAADINYLRPYVDVCKPNVDGTKNMLDFCGLGRQKVLHYISSVSVYGAPGALLDMKSVPEEFDLKISAPIMSHENGYTRAKWVSEDMVMEAKSQGLPVNVYRPGFIVGHTNSGISNKSDLFCRILTGCIMMKAYPDYPEKYWLPVPVDYVSRVVVHVISLESTGDSFNVVPDRLSEPSHNDIFEMVTSLGYPLRKLTPRDWITMLKTISQANTLYPVVPFLSENVYYGRRSILEVHHITPRMQADRTKKAMSTSGVTCPKLDPSLLQIYLKHFQASNLIPSVPSPNSL